MKAYLDNNIIVSIEDKEFELDDIKKNIDNSISIFAISSAHIQETKELKGKTIEERQKRILNRLELLDSVSSNNYLEHDWYHKNVYFTKSKSKEVFDRIGDNDSATNAMKSFVNLIPEFIKKKIRAKLNIDSTRINNIKPSEIIDHLNTKLPELGTDMTFMEMIEKSIQMNPQGKDFGLHNRIGGIFEFLDMLGYWKDSYTEKSNFARLMDARHTFFGAHCDYFISNDKRTRYKARIVYEYYKIKTIVVDYKGND
jgi:hypothetical protein